MSIAAIADPSGIASRGFTPSQNCMAYWRSCLTAPGFPALRRTPWQISS